MKPIISNSYLYYKPEGEPEGIELIGTLSISCDEIAHFSIFVPDDFGGGILAFGYACIRIDPDSSFEENLDFIQESPEKLLKSFAEFVWKILVTERSEKTEFSADFGVISNEWRIVSRSISVS